MRKCDFPQPGGGRFPGFFENQNYKNGYSRILIGFGQSIIANFFMGKTNFAEMRFPPAAGNRFPGFFWKPKLQKRVKSNNDWLWPVNYRQTLLRGGAPPRKTKILPNADVPPPGGNRNPSNFKNCLFLFLKVLS